MRAKHEMTVSNQTTKQRLSPAELRAARVAEIATAQADLKREAAERRAQQAKKTTD